MRRRQLRRAAAGCMLELLVACCAALVLLGSSHRSPSFAVSVLPPPPAGRPAALALGGRATAAASAGAAALEGRPHAGAAAAAAAAAAVLLGAVTRSPEGRWPRQREQTGGIARGAEAAEGSTTAEPEKEEGSDLALQATLFLIYFCTQSGMNFYMKWILSKIHVAQNLVGVPASFLVTSCQQIVGFLLVMSLLLGSRLVGRPYTPKPLASSKELILVLLLSASFALNIGLNLFSLVLIPLSLNLIVRSCLPLSTALSQTLIQRKTQDISPGEWGCMVAGVLCAVVVVIAKSGGPAGSSSPAFYFGVAMVVASIFCGAFDMVFKSVLGTSVKLSPMDTTYHMALPVATFTALIGSAFAKPVSATWAARFGPTMTDIQVFKELWQLNPGVLGWVVASGVLAFCYNVFQTFLVVKLSPATTSFAGNFNKAATVLISLVFLEGRLPPGPRGKVLALAIVGNIAAFALYNALKGRRKAASK